MSVSRNRTWWSVFTRNGLIALAVLTVALYTAAAATGFDNILAALWMVPAVLLLIGIVVAWRRRRAVSQA
jgi:LPXTG-motif cell wall-anchored protein